MQTYTTAAPAVRHAPTASLMLDAVPAARRRDLTAGRHGGPVLREAPATVRAAANASRLARDAVADARSAEDRVLDRVVDGLMAELGWGGGKAPQRSAR